MPNTCVGDVPNFEVANTSRGEDLAAVFSRRDHFCIEAKRAKQLDEALKRWPVCIALLPDAHSLQDAGVAQLWHGVLYVKLWDRVWVRLDAAHKVWLAHSQTICQRLQRVLKLQAQAGATPA